MTAVPTDSPTSSPAILWESRCAPTAAIWRSLGDLIPGALLVCVALGVEPVVSVIDSLLLRAIGFLPWSLDDLLDVPVSPADAEPPGIEASTAAYATLQMSGWDLLATAIGFGIFVAGAYLTCRGTTAVARSIGTRAILSEESLSMVGSRRRVSVPLGQIATIKARRTPFGTDLLVRVRGRKKPWIVPGVRDAETPVGMVEDLAR